MKQIAFAWLGLGLLISGCGEQLSNEAQKAVEQVKGEASKAAVKAIDDMKTDALSRLKQVQGTPQKSDQQQAPNGEKEAGAGNKDQDLQQRKD
jgi:Tfp pilus assembly protein PilP